VSSAGFRLAELFVLRASLVHSSPLLGMSQLVRLVAQNLLPIQGWCLAKRGSQAGKRRNVFQLGIQSHKASPRCRGKMQVSDPLLVEIATVQGSGVCRDTLLQGIIGRDRSLVGEGSKTHTGRAQSCF